jgi:hypothetical protein
LATNTFQTRVEGVTMVGSWEGTGTHSLDSSSFVGRINGQNVEVDLLGSKTMRHVDFNHDRVNIYVNGKLVFSGIVGTANLASLMTLLESLGAVNSQALGRIDAQRETTMMVFNMNSQRVADSLNPFSARAHQVAESRVQQYADASNRAAETTINANGVSLATYTKGAYQHIENSSPTMSYDGLTAASLTGMDALFTNGPMASNILVGLGVGYHVTDIKTSFNGGNLRSDGVIILPYAAVGFLDNRLVVDVAGTYQSLSIDTKRWGSVPNIIGHTDGDRFGIRGGLTYNQPLPGNFMVSGLTNVTHAHDGTGGYIESDNSIGRATTTDMLDVEVGGRLSYFFDAGRVWGGLSYHHDLIENFTRSSITSSMDHDRGEALIGVSYNATPNLSLNLSGNTTFLYQDHESLGFIGGIGYRF